MSGYWPKGITKGAKLRVKSRREVEREAKKVEADLDKLGKEAKQRGKKKR